MSGRAQGPGMAVNPFLPEWEYVPDGEPHVFGDRVYLYGSHDRFGAPIFCVGDYVCWSAPVDDLSSWRREGVIYRRGQDPTNRLGLRLLFAPDVCQGPDGRFYLYYAFDFMGTIGVAVCDTPAGAYEYLGRVSHPDGTPYGRRAGDGFAFDPAVLVDDGRVWLYSGFRTPVPALATGGVRTGHDGAYVLELEPDMLTVRGGQRLLMRTDDPSFEGHGFFEASSIRKLDGRYVFAYSSVANHELCYATSDRPDAGFSYGGVLVSIGDVGLPGHPDEPRAANYLGNTHGGLLRLGGQTYVFYHRQTNRSSYARQACAERLVPDGRGGWLQAEVTSCGLAEGPLPGVGTYRARIACNLWGAGGAGRVDGPCPRRALSRHPFLTQEGRGEAARQYVANLRDGAVCGYKYLDLTGTRGICLRARGRGAGVVEVAADEGFAHVLGTVAVGGAPAWADFSAPLAPAGSRSPLYLRYSGRGHMDLLSFELLA